MKIKAYVEVEVQMKDGSEPPASMTEKIHEDLTKYVRYGVHMLADGQDTFKYMTHESGTEELRDSVQLESLLEEYLEIHEEPCRYDHHGYCQAHFVEEDCLVKRTKEALNKEATGGDIRS